jgi:hypothetical protein
MATNGRVIVYNPEFVEGLTAAELEAVVAHETLHCGLGHHCRRAARDPELWNEAADLAINPILVANKFTLPAGVLLDPAYQDLSAEEIYARRQRTSESGSFQAPNQQPGQGAGPSSNPEPPSAAPSPTKGDPSGACPAATKSVQSMPIAELGFLTSHFGEVPDATDDEGRPPSPAEKSRQQQEWSAAADQAVVSAKSCGREPSDLERPLT